MNSGEESETPVDAPLVSGLYVIGTPIGNLRDVTFRALETLRAVDAVLAEDTRHTLKLLQRYDIRVPLISYHKFNEAQRTAQVVDRIQNGARLGLVTDSGMPGISDPGSRVVAACHAAQVPVFVVPGPSAVPSAIACCGFDSTGFTFDGFLPNKSATRRRRLEALCALEHPVVVYESPYRAIKTLTELCEIAPDRVIYVGRELTKRFEHSWTGTPSELLARFEGRSTKGEWVMVLNGPRRSGDASPPQSPPR